MAAAYYTPTNGSYNLPNAFNPSAVPNTTITPPTQSTQPTQPSGTTASAYRTDLNGWNPYQYATNATTNNLTKLLGGTATSTQGATGGPFAVPAQNSIDFGNGYVANAGLTQQFIDTYGLDRAKQMFGDMAKVAAGGSTGIGTDPSLQGYNAALTAPTTYNNVSPFTNTSLAQTTGNQPVVSPTYTPMAQQQITPPQPTTQQQNPFAMSGQNSLSGIAQILSFLSLLGLGQQLQQPTQNPLQSYMSMMRPNTSLYFPLFG